MSNFRVIPTDKEWAIEMGLTDTNSIVMVYDSETKMTSAFDINHLFSIHREILDSFEWIGNLKKFIIELQSYIPELDGKWPLVKTRK